MALNFICAQAELSAGLHLISRAVSTRPTHPILSNVLLSADAASGRVRLTGFDLNLGIQTSIPAEVKSDGAITLPARLLNEIVSRLPSDTPVTLTELEDTAEVELISLSGSYKVRSMPAQDFPDLPVVKAQQPVAMPADLLIKGLRSTLFASSSDESKQLLTGVHLALADNGLECAATDGHRLAVLHLDDFTAQQADPFAVTVPARSLRELERLLSARQDGDELAMHFDRGQVVFHCGDQVLTSRTLDGTYPAYGQLIPDSFSRSITVDRRKLIASLDRVAVLADQHNNIIKLSVNAKTSEVLIQADAQDVGSGSESLAADVEGKSVDIAFNVHYLLEGLKAMAVEQVTLQCNEPTTPAVIVPSSDDEAYTYLVMPVQIRN